MTDPRQTTRPNVVASSGDQLPADPALEAWRRESDYWLKRLERADDQAAGLLTACLTIGVVGAAAAGYVQARANDHLIYVKVGLGLLIGAGLLTLAVRMWSSPVTRRWHKLKKHQGPGDATAENSLLDIETDNATTHMKLAQWRERGVGLALIAFAAAVVLIAYAGYQALAASPPKKQPTASQPDGVPPTRGAL